MGRKGVSGTAQPPSEGMKRKIQNPAHPYANLDSGQSKSVVGGFVRRDSRDQRKSSKAHNAEQLSWSLFEREQEINQVRGLWRKEEEAQVKQELKEQGEVRGAESFGITARKRKQTAARQDAERKGHRKEQLQFGFWGKYVFGGQNSAGDSKGSRYPRKSSPVDVPLFDCMTLPGINACCGGRGKSVQLDKGPPTPETPQI